jgi:hypothetical protein
MRPGCEMAYPFSPSPTLVVAGPLTQSLMTQLASILFLPGFSDFWYFFYSISNRNHCRGTAEGRHMGKILLQEYDFSQNFLSKEIF